MIRLKNPWFVLAVVVFLLFVPLPLGPAARHWFALTNTVENLGHPLVFWWLATHIFAVARRHVAAPWLKYLVTFAVAVALGAATEFAQSFVGRDSSWEDVRGDALGVLFALALQGRRDFLGARRHALQNLATLTAVLVAVVALFPFAWTGTAYLLRWQAFPVLWSPDALFTHRFSYWKQDAFPGLVIDEPARDWRGYTALQVQVRSLRATGTEIRIRVHDQQHNQEFLDRYDRAFELPDTRERTLTIPLEAIRRGPAGRELDLSAVRGLIIFQEAAREPPRFAVGEIRLVR